MLLCFNHFFWFNIKAGYRVGAEWFLWLNMQGHRWLRKGDGFMSNRCCSINDALTFLEELKAFLPCDESFQDRYETTMNRIRYELSKAEGIAPKTIKAKVQKYGDFYACGKCGHSLSIHYDHCPKCGKPILWVSPRCLSAFCGG